ncbi:MAG TPA: hypothetical protein VLC74_07725 [Rhizomicrobium sp.]|nr:hypothetical protein [Rhizomicrobium sp.]
MSVFKMIVFIAAANAFASSSALAGHNGSPLHSLKQPPLQVLKLKNEAFVIGNGNGTPFPQFEFTPIDSGTVLNCKSKCILSASASVQVATGGADWALCLVMDGAPIECQYQGVQSGPRGFVMGNAQVAARFGAGAHTFQTQLYADGASATYEYFSMHYAVHE